MAVVGPVRELQDETVCPLCSRYFEDPVAIDCDHSYCRACITAHWQSSPAGLFVCPQCFQTSQRMHLRTNVQLSVMVKIAKNLNFAPVKQAPRPTVQQRPLVRSVQYNTERKVLNSNYLEGVAFTIRWWWFGRAKLPTTLDYPS